MEQGNSLVTSCFNGDVDSGVGSVTDVSEVHALSVFRVEACVHVLIRLSLLDAREGSACSGPSETLTCYQSGPF